MAILTDIADPMVQKRLQTRTRLVVEMYEPAYDRDYGSYGHEDDDDKLWWFDGGEVFIASGNDTHYMILGDSDDIHEDDDDRRTCEDYVRGRYSPANERISLIPALMDDCCTMDYDIPREVFQALEETFPDAVEVEVF